MKYRKLGTSLLEVSEVSFGCMSLGSDTTENNRLISAAIDGGINLFDTADIYERGHNEEMLGAALKKRRTKVIIASKVGNRLRADGSGWDWAPTKSYILAEIENSLRRLQTDYLDLYQLHGGTLDDPIDEIIEAFELLKQQGKIRFYGISSIRPNVIREYIRRSSITSVMMQYSMLDRRPEEICFPLLEDARIGILVRGSIAKGLLAGKPAAEYLRYSKPDVHKLATAVASISSETRNQMQSAVRYVLQHPPVSSAVIGIRTAEQLQSALAVPGTLPLTHHELEYLNQVLHPNFYEEHR
ncbi:MAG: aldo/keto reductase [Chitinophagaceae bacterium]|nr:MAG: aldo/keto reductase [Chitinophagaceae bacterium]